MFSETLESRIMITPSLYSHKHKTLIWVFPEHELKYFTTAVNYNDTCHDMKEVHAYLRIII